MVFKQNKLSFDHDDTITCQVASHHVRQLDFGSQFPSSAHRRIPEKQPSLDGVRHGGNLEFERMTAVTSNVNSWIASDNNVETVRSENNKRPVGFEDNLQTAAKRAKQMDGNYPLFSSTSEESFTSMADEESKSRKEAAVPESSDDSYGNYSGFPWYSCGTSEDNRLSSFPGYYEDHCKPVAFNHIPRKPVSIGPDHQAVIPSWRPKSSENCRRGDNGPDASTNENIRKIDCHCFDRGSVRCARQHVMEARERLRSGLGHERFLELGLCEMGEDVALGWTEEEEELFDEVVASNPASLGRNFWDHLPRALPSRSGKELVSYYFNVFVLRKRAEQNRWDPSNADSDNDEWQREGEEDEDEEDESGVESPTDRVEGDIPEGKSKCDNGDVHDDSCTSYEDDLNHGNLLHGEFRGGGIGDYDVFVGDCYRKPWDVSFIGGLDKELDLLPTCVIEEVFGSGSWEKS